MAGKSTGELDAALLWDWTQELAKRWLVPHPLYERDDLPPEAVRNTASTTIWAAAEKMAEGPGQVRGECSTDSGDIAEWLRRCANDIAQRDGTTVRESAIPELQTDKPAKGPAASRRWCALLRETTQGAGCGWLRGRDTGPASFTVARIGTVWTVIEHGSPSDHEQFRTRLINAVAAATVRQATQGNRAPASVLEVAGRLHQTAIAYCASPEAQPPAWATDEAVQ